MNKSESFKVLLQEITNGTDLNYDQSVLAFNIIMSGEATDSQIGSFLTAIKMRGHNSTIIAAGAEIMRMKCLKVKSKKML